MAAVAAAALTSGMGSGMSFCCCCINGIHSGSSTAGGGGCGSKTPGSRMLRSWRRLRNSCRAPRAQFLFTLQRRL
jgi:hypothetical protein